MSRDYQMTGGFLDGFQVSFDRKDSIICDKAYPLGTFATEYLELDWERLRDLDDRVRVFQEEFTVFLSARDLSSAAVAQQALNAVWSILKEFPVYQHISGGEPYNLLHYMREHPDEVDDMLTPGARRNQMMHRWLGRMKNLQSSLEEFMRETERMLILYFDNLESRRPEDYAATYGRYKRDMDDAHTLAMEEREEDDTVEEPELAQVSFPVQVSFQTIWTGEKSALGESPAPLRLL